MQYTFPYKTVQTTQEFKQNTSKWVLLRNGRQQAFDTPSWHLTCGTLIKFKAILTKGI